MNEELIKDLFKYRKNRIKEIMTYADRKTPDWIKGAILSHDQQRLILEELNNLETLILEEMKNGQ